MKKLLIVIFTIVVATALMSCGGNSAPASDNGSGTVVTDDTSADSQGSAASVPSGAGERLSAAYANMMKSGKFYMRYTMEMNYNGETSDGKIEGAYDNDDFAMISETNVGGAIVKSRIIKKGDTMYIVNDAEKTCMEMPASASPESSDEANYNDLTYLDNGTDTIKGRTLPYEEYDSDGATIRYYFDGKNLYAIESKDAENDASTVMIIEELSDKIPAGIFDIPADYAIMKM